MKKYITISVFFLTQLIWCNLIFSQVIKPVQNNTSIVTSANLKLNGGDISVEPDEMPKNIILMIGDGMGVSHIRLAQKYASYGLNIIKCDNTAIVSTSSANDEITDSAAAGTAMATGEKTNNGSIGVDADGIPVKSILKYAEDNGLATGLIATSEITHATPASFIASVEHRSQADKIAAQFLSTDIDLFIGGGLQQFNNRKDSINYVDSLVLRDYEVIYSLSDLQSVNTTTTQKLAGLLYPKHAPKVLDGRGDMLTVSTSKAIEMLSQDKDGFFLMVEGSQIDWGAHDGDVDYIVTELLDFDKAVGVALDFAAKNTETLVIVVADHETGGLTLIEDPDQKDKMIPHFSTTDHTAANVALFATGKGAKNFSGIMENTQIFSTIFALYGFSR